MELESKVAIVTGGGGGIGPALVLDLGAQGANVVFPYRSNEIRRAACRGKG